MQIFNTVCLYLVIVMRTLNNLNNYPTSIRVATSKSLWIYCLDHFCHLAEQHKTHFHTYTKIHAPHKTTKHTFAHYYRNRIVPGFLASRTSNVACQQSTTLTLQSINMRSNYLYLHLRIVPKSNRTDNTLATASMMTPTEQRPTTTTTDKKTVSQIEKVFGAASHKKVWDHFTRAQRKNIDVWKKQATVRIDCETHSYRYNPSEQCSPIRKLCCGSAFNCVHVECICFHV